MPAPKSLPTDLRQLTSRGHPSDLGAGPLADPLMEVRQAGVLVDDLQGSFDQYMPQPRGSLVGDMADSAMISRLVHSGR